MTRKSAIAHLAHKITACKTFGESWADNVNVVALEMATSALEKQENGKWIPLKTRSMDEDERKELADKLGYEPEDYEAVIYTSPFPDVGQEVLICLKSGDIRIDSFDDDADGVYHYGFADMEDVAAWMPLPKPWGEEQ